MECGTRGNIFLQFGIAIGGSARCGHRMPDEELGSSKVVVQRMLIFIYICFARLHGLQRTRGVRSYVRGAALLGGGRPVALVGVGSLPRFVVQFLLRS